MMNKSGVAALLALGLGLAMTPPAAAQSDEERAGARAAAIAGEEAFDQGRYADAIDLFSRAEKVVHAPPHLLFIGRAHLKLGQFVRAQEIFIKLNLEELGASAPQAFRDAKASAQRELGALEPRIPYLTVTVQGGGAKDPRVVMDGERVPDALVGVPRPVDPGKHVFRAFAEGMESSETTVAVKEGGRETLMLTLQAITEPAAQPSADGAAASPGPSEPASDAVAEEDSGGGMSPLLIGSIASFGVGAVGLAVGTIFAIQKGSKNDDADAIFACAGAPGGCTPEQQAEVRQLEDDASSAGTLSVVGFVAGGLGIAGGVTLLVLDMQQSDTAALELRDGDVSLRPWMGYQSAGVSGTF